MADIDWGRVLDPVRVEVEYSTLATPDRERTTEETVASLVVDGQLAIDVEWADAGSLRSEENGEQDECYFVTACDARSGELFGRMPCDTSADVLDAVVELVEAHLTVAKSGTSSV